MQILDHLGVLGEGRKQWTCREHQGSSLLLMDEDMGDGRFTPRRLVEGMSC